MKISAFSFVRNGVSLYYPVVESIRSALPLVEEFVIAVGQGSPGDTTRDQIAGIGDPRIRIIDTVWDPAHFHRGAINALQTDIAMHACTGDWLIYLQADEVLHEQDLPVIRNRMLELHDDPRVEGLLFRYHHFWGDYDHCFRSHAWYSREIRAVRNRPDIHSWHSAQSFRAISRYEHPWQTGNARKLGVADVAASIYHYGWVRPPRLMQNKNRALRTVHAGTQQATREYDQAPEGFQFGPLDDVPRFNGTHPAVMQARIAAMDWQDELACATRPAPGGIRHRHQRLKSRILSWIEWTFFDGEQVFGSRNYRRICHPCHTSHTPAPKESRP